MIDEKAIKIYLNFTVGGKLFQGEDAIDSDEQAQLRNGGAEAQEEWLERFWIGAKPVVREQLRGALEINATSPTDY